MSPCTKVKVIETSIYMTCIRLLPCQVWMPIRLNIVWGITTNTASCRFETQLWPWAKVMVIRLANIIYTFSLTTFTTNLMSIAWTVSEIIEHLLFSSLRSVWPWMKVKVNIINVWCIHMTEAVTVSNLIMIDLMVSEIWLATDRLTNKHTDRLLCFVYIKLFKVFTLFLEWVTINQTLIIFVINKICVTLKEGQGRYN